MAIKLKNVVTWGRSFDEYRRMFDLSDLELAGPILGCGDGPASFNAEATALGCQVTSCDPIYDMSSAGIEQRVLACREDLVAQVRLHIDGFIWKEFRDPEHLGECRVAAMRLFLADFARGRNDGRYVTASLPTLPFVDNQFDLALVSHLLFLYSEQLDYDFHRRAVLELLRVAMEVRIFPLLTLERKLSPHLAPLLAELGRQGCVVEKRQVPYEFQRGGNEMLRIVRPAAGQ